MPTANATRDKTPTSSVGSTAITTPSAAEPTFLERADLDRLIQAMRADGRQVIGPTVRDGAVILDEIATADELPSRRARDAGARPLPPR